MESKIWGNYKVHPLIDKYTKGSDLTADSRLLKYDIEASLAHINMLFSIKVLNKSELKLLNNSLSQIKKNVDKDKFIIPEHYEDGHSYLEAELTAMCGETGKKVHFLRSRNDQSAVMLRLFMKDVLTKIETQIGDIVQNLQAQSAKNMNVPMPGYTHMQKAMPASVSMWLESYSDGLEDLLGSLKALKKIIDQNPLGTGAGFGFSGQKIQPHRDPVTKKLGFFKTQQNPMYCGMSRGYFELIYLQSLHPLSLLASQWSSDMLMFTMSEFSYFSLPKSFTTGSSIMPQKHNFDVLEIMRGQESSYWGNVEQIHGIIAKKTSGYQRDLQLTKLPFVQAIDGLSETLQVWLLVIKNLQINEENLKQSMTPELHATAQANDLVAGGQSFREAYLTVKKELENLNEK